MLYFTELPDHKSRGFNEQSHFDTFTRHNITFNALTARSRCDDHVGCLSIKTVLSGEEWYGFNGLYKAVRPGQFLILNHNQPYSSAIEVPGKTRSLSVFFTKDFASAVFQNAIQTVEVSLDTPFENHTRTPEFFQTLCPVDTLLWEMLSHLITRSDDNQCAGPAADEQLVFLLHHLLSIHRSEVLRSQRVDALKRATRMEIYKRLCIAKDLLHSAFMNNVELSTLSHTACLSIPQLVRQFKMVYQTTPYQYLMRIRLDHSTSLLKKSRQPVNEIALACGFENTSAFCRAFKSAYGVTPLAFRASDQN
jgi:AraC family transcriptional regulator